MFYNISLQHGFTIVLLCPPIVTHYTDYTDLYNSLFTIHYSLFGEALLATTPARLRYSGGLCVALLTLHYSIPLHQLCCGPPTLYGQVACTAFGYM